jgi:endoglucanase
MKKHKFYSIISIVSLATIIITQYSCNKETTDTISLMVTPDSLIFEADSSGLEITISCNSLWSITNTADWCILSESTAENNASVYVTALENTTGNQRTTTIFISAGELTRQIEVVQKSSTDTIPGFIYDIPPDNSGIRELTSVELSSLMGVGWNIGNSLDAIGGETNWGNPKISQRLIDSVKTAGFTSVRIPIAWSKFSDESTFTIENSWMERVEEVVNYVLNNEMYAIINIHWDGGWMQPTYSDEEYVNERLEVMWKQIATHFRDYNDYLLFAGTNEVMVKDDYGTPTKEYYTVQNGFNQTFVTTVRATGGRNAYRHLVVQGFNTNIGHTIAYAELPADVTENRLMMEVHYYDPYNFTLNENSTITQWGSIATEPSKTDSWGGEDYADSQFLKMKTNFVDKGVGVILGEYGVISRLDVTDHETYRRYYLEYITHSIVEHGLVPFYWDNGFTGDHGMGIFNRNTGGKAYPELVDAIVSAAK